MTVIVTYTTLSRTTIREESTFIVYSLHRHHVVKRLPLPSVATFSSNKHFTVIVSLSFVCLVFCCTHPQAQSTINPPTLHILSPVTFATLYTISSAFLVTIPLAVTRTNNNVSLSEIESEQIVHGRRKASPGQSVFALSGRLLAYVSSPPLPASPDTASSRRPQTQTQTHNRSTSGGFGAGVHLTQADLSHMAMKVGGSVLSGMKSLGEKAYSAAMSRAGIIMERDIAAGGGISGTREESDEPRMSGVGRFFSRSAPTASNHERPYPTSPNIDPKSDRDELGGHSLPDHVPTVAPHAFGFHSPFKTGHYVTVLDLASLSGGSVGKPRKVAEFLASKHQSITRLSFSRDGNSIMVSPKDGQVLQIFQLRPAAVVSKVSLDTGKGEPAFRRDVPWHMYNLRRGRTTAVVEGVDWAEDGRWIAIGTRKRTIHVFAVNPFGGNPDLRSHTEGRVRNYTELVSHSQL